MRGIRGDVLAVFLLSLLCGSTPHRTSCPSFRKILPCYCIKGDQTSGNTIICSGIDSSNQLMEITKAMKGSMIKKLLLLNSFHNKLNTVEVTNDSNEVEFEVNERERLPNKWLAAVRVKELEIQHASLSSCFLCDEPLLGQGDFLVSLSATHSSLDGHLCNSCNTRTKSVSLRELIKVPRLTLLDLSWNNIEVIDGMAFPSGLLELKKVYLSNNKIKTIHDNAFGAVPQLTHLDLSNNHLAALPRRAFRSGASLLCLDLSWNSLQALPEGIFNDLRSIKELKVSYNLLELLPSGTWSRTPLNIDMLDFHGNFLVCNCSMSWMARFANKPTRIHGKCVYPSNVESQDVKSIVGSLTPC